MKTWTTRTVLNQLDVKCREVFGDGVLDADSPVRDETVGDVLDTLIMSDYGMVVEIPGQTSIPLPDTKLPDAKSG